MLIGEKEKRKITQSTLIPIYDEIFFQETMYSMISHSKYFFREKKRIVQMRALLLKKRVIGIKRNLTIVCLCLGYNGAWG
jgi:hypothetical protein